MRKFEIEITIPMAGNRRYQHSFWTDSMRNADMIAQRELRRNASASVRIIEHYNGQHIVRYSR